MLRIIKKSASFTALSVFALVACQSSPLPSPSSCSNSPQDSQDLGGGNYSIISPLDGYANYYRFSSPRGSHLGGGTVTLSYMVNEPPAGTPARALLVLIPGGQFSAGIGGSGDGTSANAYGHNFLVRSARLFSLQGYRVVTMERPSDYIDYTGGSSNGFYMDSYRSSLAQAVDLGAIVARVNTARLPVILAGTSRGAITAVAQANLFTAIALSSPVTGGTNGEPVTHADAARVTVPAQVIWHQDDSCDVTVPVNSYTLSSAFPDGSGQGLSGGFGPAGNDPCGALSHHGFFGIESCAVTTTTAWLDALSLPASLPDTTALTATVPASTTTSFDLSSAAAAAKTGAPLNFSLPYTTTTLGGTVSISGTTLSYTAPSKTGIDSFVYQVRESGGGTAFNTVSISVN